VRVVGKVAEISAAGADWVWIVGPGSTPAPDGLETLVAALERLDGLPRPVLLAGTTGEALDAPWPRFGDKGLEVAAVERGLVAVRATTCASVLVDAAALGQEPLPAGWAAEIAFTARLLRDRPGYLVPESRATRSLPAPSARDRLRVLATGRWRFAEGAWAAVRLSRDPARTAAPR
jgi:hypothetical protein